MTQTPTRYDIYQSSFQSLEESRGKVEPAWLRQLREHAWSRFLELGFPTARRGNEPWKYTNVAPIARADFPHPIGLAPDTGLTRDDVRGVAPWQEDWANLVFVDGRYAAGLSSAVGANGLQVGSLAAAIETDPKAVEPHLAQHVSVEEDGFAALNTAFLQDGAFVRVPANAVDLPVLHLVFLTTNEEQPRVTYPRTLVVVGHHSQVTVIESYVSLSEARYFTNAVTEVVVEDGASVEHYRLLLESPQAFHVGTSRVTQGQDASFTSVAFARGAALGRNDFQVLLDAPGAFCSLNGLYLTSGTQHMDNLINIDHAKPHGTSRLFYKGILDDRSKAVFGGTVLVREDAQKTDAQQTDKNLILSDRAEVDSKPSLLIFADDVKCGHGATAGNIDQDTLFYMRSRGLDQETASRILIHGFASEIIETVQLEPLQEYLNQLFAETIPGASLLPLGGA
ncbi:MAG: Fe-S cluster assembly protein SufD [Dehalococcoidia bacterium]